MTKRTRTQRSSNLTKATVIHASVLMDKRNARAFGVVCRIAWRVIQRQTVNHMRYACPRYRRVACHRRVCRVAIVAVSSDRVALHHRSFPHRPTVGPIRQRSMINVLVLPCWLRINRCHAALRWREFATVCVRLSAQDWWNRARRWNSRCWFFYAISKRAPMIRLKSQW